MSLMHLIGMTYQTLVSYDVLYVYLSVCALTLCFLKIKGSTLFHRTESFMYRS